MNVAIANAVIVKDENHYGEYTNLSKHARERCDDSMMDLSNDHKSKPKRIRNDITLAYV